MNLVNLLVVFIPGPSLKMLQPQFVKRDSACLFPKSYKNMQTSMASMGILSTTHSQRFMIATAQVHMSFCVMHFRSPSSSQIAKSPRNRSELRVHMKQNFKKKVIFNARAQHVVFKSPQLLKGILVAKMFQMIL